MTPRRTTPAHVIIADRRDPSARPAPCDTTAAGGGSHGLLEALAQVPDLRDPRGIRYPPASLLAVAVCAVMAGASTFAAIGD
ncbi:transposase family protein [Micromonospora sp. LOL_024]|uniref:transposase family protein n=1 Tax=Micromonospora sp. LOL_024 TaxID=3345412 RepID=UPI003A87D76D